MKFDKRLSKEISQLESEPVPTGLRDKLMAEAMTAADAARAQTPSPAPRRLSAQGVFTMRRVCLAAAFALLMTAVGLWFFPRQNGNAALADVSRAMAKVKSVHFVGWEEDSNHGRSTMEGWIEGDSKLRYQRQGEKWLEDYGDDGKTVVEVNTYSRNPCATIRPSQTSERWPMELSVSIFRGHNILENARNPLYPCKITSRRSTLPDGRTVVIYTLGWPQQKTTLTVDADSDLILRMESLKHFDEREVREAIDRIEYNMEIPDSVFRPSIPKAMRVLDLTKSLSPAIAKRRQAEKKRLQSDPTVHITWHIPGGNRSSCGAIYRKGYMFEVAGPGEVMIAYVPALDVYRVIGTVRAFSQDGSYSRYAEDEDVRLPGKPNLHEYEKALLENAGPGAYRGIKYSNPRRGFQRFLNVGDGPLTVLLDTHRDVYIIKGTAKLVPFGIVYQNQTIKTGDIPDIRAVSDPEKLDWAGLPEHEVEVAKAELDVRLRVRELYNTRDAEGRFLIDGEWVKITNHCDGGYSDGRIRIEPAGIGPTATTLGIKSKRVYVVIGRVKVFPSGKICKNGRISFDGKVISSEE